MTYESLVFYHCIIKKLKMTLANFSVKRFCPPVPPVKVGNLELGSEQGMKCFCASYNTVIVLDELFYLTYIDG